MQERLLGINRALHNNKGIHSQRRHNSLTTKCQKCEKKKLTELQRDSDKFTIIFGEFNTPPSEMDRPNKQKISQDIVKLNNIIN